jgi:hypothetical protein
MVEMLVAQAHELIAAKATKKRAAKKR